MASEKLDTPVFRSIMTEDLIFLFDLFRKNSYELKIAGGAVRDLLMDIKPHDIDFATDATPDQMKKMFKNENIRMLNMNGEKHGTITIRMHDKENYEITTLRIDKLTDGRHAEIEFTHDWRLDANRRDLTINSIFLDGDGTIIDYFGGYHDIKNHKIKFVGEPSIRIQEDYLRILRYFRFYSRICLDENSHDQPSLDAIKEHSSGLSRIAGERLWIEFRKIVISKFADSIMKHIVETNVHKYIGLPDNCNLVEFSRIYKAFENRLNEMPSPITMVVSLLESENQFEVALKRMKFSNEEKRIAEFIFTYRNIEKNDIQSESSSLDTKLKKYKFILVDNVKDSKIIEKLIELLKYLNKLEYFDHLEKWTIPIFPITGDMLSERNIPKGPLFTKILNILKETWKIECNLNTNQETIDKLLEDINKITS